VKADDHDSAARILIKVTAHISKFPLHSIQIRTSTIIECLKAGLKKSAYENAVILTKPESRNLIDPKYRKKIESLVRRPDEELVDPAEASSPCPICDSELANTCLDCVACKNIIPYCVVSARHMVKGDWSECYECRMPALYSEITKIAGSGGSCPMCSLVLDSKRLVIL
jgi:WD repeat-containing protein 19